MIPYTGFVLRKFPHPDFFIINYDKAITPGGGGHICYESINCTPGLFNSCRPYAKSNDPMVMAQGVIAGVSKILIVGYDDCSFFLRPQIEEIVGSSLKSEFVDVLNFPIRQLSLQPARKSLRYVLVK